MIKHFWSLRDYETTLLHFSSKKSLLIFFGWPIEILTQKGQLVYPRGFLVKGLKRLTALKEAVGLADLLLSAINDMTSAHF